MKSENSSFILLDWLRFSAAFMVVLKHSKDVSFVAFADLHAGSQLSLVTKIMFAATRYGVEAVLVFFVLSGFLVGGSTFQRLKDGSFDVGQYAIDRTSRIMLPLIPAVAIAAIVQCVLGLPPSVPQILGNLFSFQGVFVGSLPADPPLWSLSYEVWFYILNGAVAMLIAAQSRRWAFCILCVAMFIFSSLQLEYLISWYLGALLFMTNDGRSSRIGLFIAAVTIIVGAISFELFGVKSPILAVVGFALATILLIRQLANWPCKPSPWMSLGSRLASFSFSLYLIHYPVLLLLGRLLPRLDTVGPLGLSLYVVRVSICLVAGWIFFLCFERQTSSVRRWLRRVYTTGAWRTNITNRLPENAATFPKNEHDVEAV